MSSSKNNNLDDVAAQVTDDEAENNGQSHSSSSSNSRLRGASKSPIKNGHHPHSHPTATTSATTTTTTSTSGNTSNNAGSSKSPSTPSKHPSNGSGNGSGSGTTSRSPKTSSAPRSSISKPVLPKPNSELPARSTSASTNSSSGTAAAIASSTRKSSTRSKKKGITFKKTVGVHSIPNLDTYSIAEKESTWYVPDDYGKMEDECDLTAELLDRKRPLFPGQCPRGLEAWTTEGEQRKEGHVQLAIDIVWQAQLEQWKASSDIHECWEFIRSRYVAVSVPCHVIANKRGLNDESEVKAYLSGVRNVEKNRLRILGIHQRGSTSSSSSSSNRKKVHADPASATTPRSVTSRNKITRAHSEFHSHEGGSGSRTVPGRNHSSGNIISPVKGLLKNSSSAASAASHGPSGKASTTTATAGDHDDAVSMASSKGSVGSSNNGRKISYQPKSRSKVPVSPVASVMSSAADSDGDSTIRRMRSHMSVASDDSTRRRMLRTTKIKLPM